MKDSVVLSLRRQLRVLDAWERSIQRRYSDTAARLTGQISSLNRCLAHESRRTHSRLARISRERELIYTQFRQLN